MTPTISIVAIPADFNRWGELLSLIRRSFAYMDGVIDPPSSAHRLTLESLKEKAGAEKGFLALSGDHIVGCVFLADRDDHLYLGKLAVDPAMQGHGIGRMLVDAAEHHAVTVRKPTIELHVRIELASNHAAFAKLGFRETARIAHPGFTRPTQLAMRKVVLA